MTAHPGHQRRRHLLRGDPLLAAGAGAARRRSWWWRRTASRAPRGHALTLHRPLRMRRSRRTGTPSTARPPTASTSRCCGCSRTTRRTWSSPASTSGSTWATTSPTRARLAPPSRARCWASPRSPSARRWRRGSPSRRAARLRPRAGARSLLDATTLPPDLLLNVNLPAGEIQGRALHPARPPASTSRSVIEKVDPRGRKYYWIAGTPSGSADEGTDFEAVSAGRVSVTPLHLDLTDYRGLGHLRRPVRGADRSRVKT